MEQDALVAALQEKAERLELALSGSGLGVWDCDLDTGVVVYDQHWCAMLGYTPEEITPNLSGWQNLIHPEDRAGIDAAMAAHLRGETDIYQSEHRVRHKQGHWVWVLARGRIVARDVDGQALRATGTVQDVSAQKRMSQESLQLLHQIETLIRGVAQPAEARPSGAEALAVLSERQKDILRGVVAGQTSAEIARHLNISAATVATHRRDLMRRLNLHTVAALTRFALAHRLL